MNREQDLKGHKNVICCIFSVVILIVLLFPLYWTLVTSLKTEQEIFQIPPTLWPNVLNTKSYTAQLDHGDFNMFRSFGNSLLISLGATVISVVLAVPASYGIAKYKFRFRKGVLLTFLVTQMLPVSVLLTPMFFDVQKHAFVQHMAVGHSCRRNDRDPIFCIDFEKLFCLHSERNGRGGLY